MKILLLAITLCAASVALAADPVVVVNNISSVTVDGVPSGSVVDVLANVDRPNIRAKLLDALIAREASIEAAATARVVAAEASQAAAVAARQAADARVAAIVTSLRGVAPTILPASARAELLTVREKERAALLAAKKEAEDKLAALP